MKPEKIREAGCGPYILDIHRIMTDDHAELAVGRIRKENRDGHFTPVILLHGNYSKRNFWLSDKGVGFGAHLAEAGFDVWIPELRGHGLSPKGDNFSGITADDQIRYDLPAIDRLVREKNSRPLFWAGHSFGGLIILAAFSAGVIGQNNVAGVVTFSSQISKGEVFLKIPPLAWVMKLSLKMMGYFPAPALKLGPEIESAGTMIELIRWKELGGRWVDSRGFCYWDGIPDIKAPILSIAAAADRNDPPEGCRIIFDRIGSPDKTFLFLGKADGFSVDYDHIGMVVSKSAQTEVWPPVTGWMESRVPSQYKGL